ncbi:DNA-binding transcription repressor [Coemansia guatemalensis]|uniref:DNA-binding transcription repressor n=1 Tax=Coemansia guatemalensis TaxID=2761395 RepID=A0A9W8I192_9FUNG|nr:DNA-binding transcription repressor [Coemansia guatemalensis]
MAMATAYGSIAVAHNRHRHKRKGIPKRSPCRRDMEEAPGVVFRFPDKISPATRDVPGLAILPSSAGLPSGLGTKSAAAVIAAAAAVSASSPGSGILPANPTAVAPTPTNTSAATAATTATTNVSATSPTPPDAAAASDSLASTAANDDTVASAASAQPLADLPQIASAASTPILRPLPSAVSIHRSASNVLHYPELLSDLRDKLIQIHQTTAHTHASSSSGGESDTPGSHHHQRHPARRIKTKRTARGADSTTSASRRTGLRGVSGSAATTSSPGPGSSSAASRGRHEGGPAAFFQRRHSIGTIRQSDEEDEMVDIDDSVSTTSGSVPRKSAKRKRDKDGERHSKSPAAKRPTPQVGTGGRRSCASCGASSTPCWRPGLIDSKTLCNLCGLRYKKGKVYCAACSYVPTKTEIATGGASVCKRCTLPIQKPTSFGVGY